MSDTTDVLEQGSVTGGKVWTPPVTATSNASPSPKSWQEKVSDIAFVATHVALGLNIALMAVNLFVNSFDSTPEHMPFNTFNGLSGFEWADMIMFGISVLVCITLLLGVRFFDDRGVLIVISIILIGSSGFNAFTKLHYTDIRNWGEQYGYSFPIFNVPELFTDSNTVKAYNLKTEQWGEIPIEIVDGNIVLTGVEKVKESELLPELEVVSEDGMQYLLDENTGKKYQMPTVPTDATLEPKDEKGNG